MKRATVERIKLSPAVAGSVFIFIAFLGLAPQALFCRLLSQAKPWGRGFVPFCGLRQLDVGHAAEDDPLATSDAARVGLGVEDRARVRNHRRQKRSFGRC